MYMLNSSNVQKGIMKSTSNHTKGTIVKSNSTLNSVFSLSMKSFISRNHLSHLSFLSSPLFPPVLPPSSLLYISLSVSICMHVCAQSFSHAWLSVIPRTIAHQTPLSMEFSRQEYWSGLPFHSPGDLPDSGIKLVSLASPSLAGRFFTTIVIWEAHINLLHILFVLFIFVHYSTSIIILLYYVFYFIHLIFKHWSIVDLQCCANFCCRAKWLCYAHI